MDNYITMSQPELDRYTLISKLIAKRMTQREVAALLGITANYPREFYTVEHENRPGGNSQQQAPRSGIEIHSGGWPRFPVIFAEVKVTLTWPLLSD